MTIGMVSAKQAHQGLDWGSLERRDATEHLTATVIKMMHTLSIPSTAYTKPLTSLSEHSPSQCREYIPQRGQTSYTPTLSSAIAWPFSSQSSSDTRSHAVDSCTSLKMTEPPIPPRAWGKFIDVNADASVPRSGTSAASRRFRKKRASTMGWRLSTELSVAGEAI